MSSVNKAIIVGNLGRDPEVRHTQAGKKIVNMSLATSESWKDKTTGEKQERTEWHRVVVFDERLADICEKWLTKGKKVYIEGQIETRKWTGNDGVDKYTTEIVMRPFKSVLTMLDGRSEGQTQSNTEAVTGDQQPGPSGGDLDDEIPF